LTGRNERIHSSSFETADRNGKGAAHEMSETGDDRFERRLVTTVTAPKDAPRFPDLVVFARIERAAAGWRQEQGHDPLRCPVQAHAAAPGLGNRPAALACGKQPALTA
jgi:hypothetical protein